MDIIKPRIKKLSQVIAEVAANDRRRQVDRWIDALASAEAAAVARGELERNYQANYRVKSDDSATKGAADARRDALVEMLRSLRPSERHQSTSSWFFALHLPSADDIARLLAAPLDVAAGMDFVSVVEVTDNRAKRGSARLKS